MRNWKDWTKKAGIRAIKTVAQAQLPELERLHLWARWIGNMLFLHQYLPECYRF